MTRLAPRAAPASEDLLLTIGLGAAAGVAAAAATSLFQIVWTRAGLPPAPARGVRPPTETLAEEICRAATGRALPSGDIAPAGALIHLMTGAGLGVVYAWLGRAHPNVREGRGAAYGLGVWSTFEELGMAMLGLKPPPWRVKPAEHLFAAASHVVFGLSLDTVLSTALDRPQARRPAPGGRRLGP